MKRQFVFAVILLSFFFAGLAACSDNKKPSSRSQSDWSSQSAVDDIEAMKKAAEKGKTPQAPKPAEKGAQ